MSDTTYGKTALIGDVMTATGLTRAQVSAVINATLTTIQQNVQAGQAVTIPGFGSFQQAARIARPGINPQTRAKITIPASVGVRFSPSSSFKALVRGTATASAAYAQERAAGNRLEEQR